YEERMASLLRNISTYKPQLVLMYGMENITSLKSVVQAHYPKTKFSMAKAVKQRIPQHHRADLDGTTLSSPPRSPRYATTALRRASTGMSSGRDVFKCLRV